MPALLLLGFSLLLFRLWFVQPHGKPWCVVDWSRKWVGPHLSEDWVNLWLQHSSCCTWQQQPHLKMGWLPSSSEFRPLSSVSMATPLLCPGCGWFGWSGSQLEARAVVILRRHKMETGCKQSSKTLYFSYSLFARIILVWADDTSRT